MMVAGVRGQGGATRRLCTRDVARMAAIYLVNLCKATIQGCRAHPREDGRFVKGHVGILPRECDEWNDAKFHLKTEKLFNVQIVKGDKEECKDSVTGQLLNPDLVREARRKEMEYFEMMQVWLRRPRADARKYMGKPPISVHWIDVNKGADVNAE